MRSHNAEERTAYRKFVYSYFKQSGGGEMKTLKIKASAICSRLDIFGQAQGSKVTAGHQCEVIMVDEKGNETDMTRSIRSLEIQVPVDDIITAKIELYVEELDLEGVAILHRKECEVCGITLGEDIPRYPSKHIFGGVLCTGCHERRRAEGGCFGI